MPKLTNYSNFIGVRFNFLVIKKILDVRLYGGQNLTFVSAYCDCGNTKELPLCRIISGKIKTCGHNKAYKLISKHPLYRVRLGMIARCYNVNTQAYKDYGGRGISVCDEWRFSINKFYDWAISNGYENGLTIERINNDGNYDPSNCKWATRKEQAMNTRKGIIKIEYKGENRTLSEIAKLLNVRYEYIRQKVRNEHLKIEDVANIIKSMKFKEFVK